MPRGGGVDGGNLLTHDGAVLSESAVIEKTVEPTVIGDDGEEIPAAGLVLGIEKFRLPTKCYRLIWISHERKPWFAWLAEEDTVRYLSKAAAVAAGERLAAEKGVKFSEWTR